MESSRHRWCTVIAASLAAALGVAALRLGLAVAAEPANSVAVAINAGESYVIHGVKAGSSPALKVVENPNALVVHGERPGELLLLGAERGQWEISVEKEDGTRSVYDVTVSAIIDPKDRLKPGVAPGALTSGELDHKVANAPASSKAAEGPFDSGTGEIVDNSRAVKPAGPSADGASSRRERVTSLSSMPASGTASTAASGPTEVSTAPSQRSPHVIPSQAASGTIGAAATPFKSDPRAPEPPLQPGPAGPRYLPADAIILMADTSSVFDFPQRLKRISVANTKIADIQVVNPHQLQLVGHSPGFTTLAVWDDQGHYEERQVRIELNGKQQVLLSTIVAELNRQQVENQGINFSTVLPNTGLSLVGLPGQVATPYGTEFDPWRGQNTKSLMPPGGNLIPLLLSSSMTYGIAGTTGYLAGQSMFQYLETHGMAKILAEPRILANSGEKASVLSGGEIPIVIAQALNSSVAFKQYGTSVNMVPTVVGRNEIELQIKPEVSKPDFTMGVQMFGFTVPAFVTRRAETSVKLQNGQTLIIAGLILHDKTSTVDKVPYLGDIPWAGALFRHTDYQDVETDLVMSVTPEIVRPLPDGARVYQPTETGPLTSRQIETRRVEPPDAARPRF